MPGCAVVMLLAACAGASPDSARTPTQPMPAQEAPTVALPGPPKHVAATAEGNHLWLVVELLDGTLTAGHVDRDDHRGRWTFTSVRDLGDGGPPWDAIAIDGGVRVLHGRAPLRATTLPSGATEVIAQEARAAAWLDAAHAIWATADAVHLPSGRRPARVDALAVERDDRCPRWVWSDADGVSGEGIDGCAPRRVVDRGAREGDAAHRVGASLAAAEGWLAYQDQTLGHLVLAGTTGRRDIVDPARTGGMDIALVVTDDRLLVFDVAAVGPEETELRITERAIAAPAHTAVQSPR